MKKNIFILSILILGFVGGFLFGKSFEFRCQQKTEDLKAQLDYFFPPLVEEIYSFSGVVSEIADDFIITEAEIRVNQFPMPDGSHIEMQNIKVNIDDQTNIFKIEDNLLFGADDLPEHIRVGLSFKDIKIGMNVFITSQENIRDKKEIAASQIQLAY